VVYPGGGVVEHPPIKPQRHMDIVASILLKKAMLNASFIVSAYLNVKMVESIGNSLVIMHTQ
jgi:hypothetical protein